MKIMRPIVVFTSVAAIGTLSQKAQNAGISTIQPFVPSTGQINNGSRKLPDRRVFQENTKMIASKKTQMDRVGSAEFAPRFARTPWKA